MKDSQYIVSLFGGTAKYRTHSTKVILAASEKEAEAVAVAKAEELKGKSFGNFGLQRFEPKASGWLRLIPINRAI